MVTFPVTEVPVGNVAMLASTVGLSLVDISLNMLVLPDPSASNIVLVPESVKTPLRF